MLFVIFKPIMQLKTLNAEKYTWVDILNPTEEDIPEIAKQYELDILLVQDAFEAGHLPKIESRQDYYFFILRAYTAEKEISVSNIADLSTKIAFFVSKNRLITIHKKSFPFLDGFDNTYKTIYGHQIALFNHIINTFDMPAEWHAEDLDKVEEVIFVNNINRVSLEDLYFQKSEIRLSKKLLLLTQQVLNKIQMPEKYHSAMENVKDTVVQLLLEFDESLDDASNLTHTYLSIAAQKSNDVMKLLTIFSAFFLPLTFIVGVYGMNFRIMPELEFTYGYPLVMLVMAIICLLIFLWFKKKKIL